MIKPLLFYMNTSDYPEILKDLKGIPCDQYHVNYMPYPHPHNMARDCFLNHDEYTHLIVVPQDLHAKKEHYEKLIKTVQETGYDVVSAVCNVERKGHRNFNKWNICKQIPSLDRNNRYYNWMPACDEKLGLVQVEFQGLAMACISRAIMQRTTIEGEPLFKGTVHVGTNQFLAAPDLTFSHCCKNAGIPMYADTDIRIEHYANHKPTLVGKSLTSASFIKYYGSK